MTDPVLVKNDPAADIGSIGADALMAISERFGDTYEADNVTELRFEGGLATVVERHRHVDGAARVRTTTYGDFLDLLED